MRSNFEDLPMTPVSVEETKSTSQQETNGNNATATPNNQYLSGLKLYTLLSGLCLAVLLVALDTAILATAIPTITVYFSSIGDVGWYGSAYLFTSCSLQPLSGKIYMQFPVKYTFLAFLTVFELGSLVCATAASSKALIVGRAIAGMGSSGIASGAITIMALTIELEKRAAFMSIISSMFGIATIIGPLIGGVLTERVSWRWCFYITLPAGAVTAVLLMVVFQPPERKACTTTTALQKLQKLDLVGCSLFGSGCVMLLLAIQWGGVDYPWNSPTIIGLFCGFVPLIGVFFWWQHYKGPDAMVPLAILGQRTVLFSCVTMLFQMGGSLLITYYIPMWFQVVKGASSTASGVMILPTILAQVLLAVVAGVLVTKLGFYNPWMIIGGAITSVGTGLMTTFTVHESAGRWIGYQVIAGAGRGMLMQMPLIAVQNVLAPAQIPIGTALVIFCQSFGGTLFVALGQATFINRLGNHLHTYAPNVDAQMILDTGAADVRSVVSASLLEGVLVAYNKALMDTFYVAVGVACAAFCASLGLEWKSVKAKKASPPSEA